jgi:hypothetical protein
MDAAVDKPIDEEVKVHFPKESRKLGIIGGSYNIFNLVSKTTSSLMII